MLIMCKYCGRIHDDTYQCVHRKKYRNYDKNKKDPRNSRKWRSKRELIKQRDNYMCQCCYHNYKGTLNRFEGKDLSVHHIIPLSEGGELLDEDNLITLCRYHHEQAEKGKISREELQVIAKLQNKK